MASKKKLQQAAIRFRRERPAEAAKYRVQCILLANSIREHGTNR